MHPDPYDLGRFVQAQDDGASYQRALDELARGQKVSHWMWYVFPQLAGLGRSAMSQRFAIGSAAEATAYLHHPLLGPRLVAAAEMLAATTDRTAEQILGAVDAQKLRSCLTLFDQVGDQPVFGAVLEQLFAGQPDPQTLRLLEADQQADR